MITSPGQSSWCHQWTIGGLSIGQSASKRRCDDAVVALLAIAMAEGTLGFRWRAAVLWGGEWIGGRLPKVRGRPPREVDKHFSRK